MTGITEIEVIMQKAIRDHIATRQLGNIVSPPTDPLYKRVMGLFTPSSAPQDMNSTLAEIYGDLARRIDAIGFQRQQQALRGIEALVLREPVDADVSKETKTLAIIAGLYHVYHSPAAIGQMIAHMKDPNIPLQNKDFPGIPADCLEIICADAFTAQQADTAEVKRRSNLALAKRGLLVGVRD